MAMTVRIKVSVAKRKAKQTADAGHFIQNGEKVNYEMVTHKEEACL